MYGYRQIAGYCVDCMTFEEAIEKADVWAEVGGSRYRVTGELAQHFKGQNVTRERAYCWHVESTSEVRNNGNQRTKRNARCDG